MELIANKGPVNPARTGAIYELVETLTGWKIVSTKGVQYTPRGAYSFVRIGGRLRVTKAGEHVHMTGGRPVEYAGEIRFGYNRSNRGRIRYWTNGSGHYRPSAGLAQQAGLPMTLFVKEDFV